MAFRGTPLPAPESPSASALPSSATRASVYIPARVEDWNRVDVDVAGPTLLRAGGQVAVGSVISGPQGRGIDVASPSARPGDLAVPWAPYLSLVARVCSASQCSAPFVVGSRAIVCPATVGMTGKLELWTNNRVRVNGSWSRLRVPAAAGGFSVYAQAVDEAACAPAPDEASTNPDR